MGRMVMGDCCVGRSVGCESSASVPAAVWRRYKQTVVRDLKPMEWKLVLASLVVRRM